MLSTWILGREIQHLNSLADHRIAVLKKRVRNAVTTAQKTSNYYWSSHKWKDFWLTYFYILHLFTRNTYTNLQIGVKWKSLSFRVSEVAGGPPPPPSSFATLNVWFFAYSWAVFIAYHYVSHLLVCQLLPNITMIIDTYHAPNWFCLISSCKCLVARSCCAMCVVLDSGGHTSKMVIAFRKTDSNSVSKLRLMPGNGFETPEMKMSSKPVNNAIKSVRRLYLFIHLDTSTTILTW